MESPINFGESGMWNNKKMMYIGIAIVIVLVIIFFIFVFNQGEEMKNLKSLFNNKKIVREDLQEEENDQEIVNKNISELDDKNKCKNKIYKKLGTACNDKYLPPL